MSQLLPVLPVSNGSSVHTGRISRFSQHLNGDLRAHSVQTLQVNVGKRCNQACKHCHVDAGPNRTEMMDERTALACLAAIERHKIATLDLTGGAPELNQHFRMMVSRARELGAKVIVRHNLTVMFEPNQEDLPEFFAAHDVEIVSSLPHFSEGSTDRQRGAGVFQKSISAMKRLNAVGYGMGRANRVLALMHNPVGAYLPGSQTALQSQYKLELAQKHGVHFDQLYVLTNMPVKRFRDWLDRTGQLEEYQASLEAAFNHGTIEGLMCRSTVSVGWDGRLFDCDFNQMLELEVQDAPAHIEDFAADLLAKRRIVTAEHCFGCTAGDGSSCGGQIVG